MPIEGAPAVKRFKTVGAYENPFGFARPNPYMLAEKVNLDFAKRDFDPRT